MVFRAGPAPDRACADRSPFCYSSVGRSVVVADHRGFDYIRTRLASSANDCHGAPGGRGCVCSARG
jgi:hypothetical protein